MELPTYVKDYIEKYINLIDTNYEDFETFYLNLAKSGELMANHAYGLVSEALYFCDIDPLEHLDYIPDYFEYNSDIKSFEVPNHIKHIGFMAFAFCRNLESIYLSKNLVYIDDQAFNNCSNLKEIIIPEAVTSIGNFVFRDCDNLEQITFGKNINHIGFNSLKAKCLKQIIYHGSMDDWRKIEIAKYDNESWKSKKLRKIICLDGVIKL